MRRMTVGAIFAVLSPGLLAALPAPRPTPPDVKTLIARLGADSYREREKAGHDLFALGDAALPPLKAALATLTDPEARRRATALIHRIEVARLTAARRVTLKAVNRPTAQVVAELARQSGYAIRYNDGRDGTHRITLDLRDVPFWEALDRISREAGLTVYQNSDESGQVVLSYSDSYDPHVTYAGPFRVVATHINGNRNLQLAGLARSQPNPRGSEYIHLNLNLYAEPKAPLVGLGLAVATRAIDDTGASMLTSSPQAEQSISYYPQTGSYRTFQQGFGVSLTRGSSRATAIRELRGKVPVLILSEVRPEVVIEDVLEAKKQTVIGRTASLELTAAEFANDVLTLNLTVRRKQGNPDDSSWLNGLPQRLEVTDSTGEKYTFNGIHDQTAGPNLATYQLQFTTGGKKLGKPARLTLVEWVTVTRDVEFAFKDIPLP